MLRIKDVVLLRRFIQYIYPHWKWVGLSLIAIPFSTTAATLLPWLLVKIVDDYLLTLSYSGLVTIISLFGGVVFIGYFADSIYTFSLQKAGQLAIFDMRSDLFQHSLRLPRSYFDKTPIGITLSRMTSDMESVGESLATGVLSLVTEFIKTIALFGLLLFLSWKLTLLISIMLPPTFYLAHNLRKKLRFYFNLSRKALAESTSYLQECLNGVKTVQLYGAEKSVLQRFSDKNLKFLHSQSKSNIYDAILFSLIDGLTAIAVGFIIWYGSGQVLEGIITVGVLIGFINTLHKIFIPIREFTQHIAVIQRAFAALEHIEELFQRPTEEKELLESDVKENLSTFQKLEFQNVSFRYDDSGPWILNNISFQLQKGDRIALVGATGSGKSTIIKIIIKAYKNYTGSIRINDVELSQISKPRLLKLISLMQQDVYLFDESIKFNIALNRKEIDETKIREAAEYVYADEFIKQLPGTYDYQISENGKNLSGGQAQLVSFARAIAGESDLVLFDEATSSVDSVTEALIQKAIEKILGEKTVIAIAHRLSTIQHSDLILVMKEGEIVERGTHEELVNQGGYYLKLLQQNSATLT